MLQAPLLPTLLRLATPKRRRTLPDVLTQEGATAVLDVAGEVLTERIGAKESAFRRVGGEVHELEVGPAARADEGD